MNDAKIITPQKKLFPACNNLTAIDNSQELNSKKSKKNDSEEVIFCCYNSFSIEKKITVSHAENSHSE